MFGFVFARVVLAEPLIVHEWGTFTSLQDENGQTIGGINVDDEPVPKFVKRIKDYYVIDKLFDKPWYWSQGATRCFDAVTMRLETPVIYFYPQAGNTYTPFDVKVDFRQGWLTEYFPSATIAKASGFPDKLSDTSSGTLKWSKVKLTSDSPSQATKDHVWIAPRKVSAASVNVSGETEKYLFYRGVAHLPAPLRVTRKSEHLQIYSMLDDRVANNITINHLWLVDILPDGNAAYRSFGPVTISGQHELTLSSISAGFSPEQYSHANLKSIKKEMHQALVNDGLYADEAHAMLETWKLSYFKSGGTRLFYMVPQVWTDYYLPLEISIPHEIKRVMVGRLELLNPRQRASLDKIAKLPHARDGIEKVNKAFFDYLEKNKGKVQGKELTDWWLTPMEQYAMRLNTPLPESFKLFLDLGRFRDALIPYAYQTYQVEQFKDFPTRCFYAISDERSSLK